MRLILIGSIRRSGGSLLARLLDGHSDIYSFPIERRFGVPGSFLDKLGDIKNAWPDLVSALRQKDLSRIKRLTFFAQYETFRERVATKCGEGNLQLDFDSLSKQFESELSMYAVWTRQVIWQAEAKAFFSCVAGGTVWTGPRKYVAVHCATSVFLPLRRVMNEFPGSIFVYPIRNPLSYCASSKKRAADDRVDKRSCDDVSHVTALVAQWRHAALLALQYKAEFPDRFILLRYEDILNKPTSVMEGLCQKINLPFEEILVRPTILGRDWRGNSAFGGLNGISTSPMGFWKQTLTPAEIKYVHTKVGSLMDLFQFEIKDRQEPAFDSQMLCFSKVLWEVMGGIEPSRQIEYRNLLKENRLLKYRLAGVLAMSRVSRAIARFLRLK